MRQQAQVSPPVSGRGAKGGQERIRGAGENTYDR